MVSHDRLAQYWVGFGHISYYERVDVDRFLDPEMDLEAGGKVRVVKGTT